MLFLGRHEPRKGLQVLLDAFALLRAARGPLGGRRGPATRGAAAGTGADGVQWLGR